MKRFALLTREGTACVETVLTEREYADPQMRKDIEKAFCGNGIDDPQPDTWTDVTDNEACDPRNDSD